MKDQDTPETKHVEDQSPVSPSPQTPPNKYVKGAQGRLHWCHGPTQSSLCLKLTFNVSRQDLQEMIGKSDLSPMAAELTSLTDRGVVDLLKNSAMVNDFKSPANVDFNAGLAGGIKDGEEIVQTMSGFLSQNNLIPPQDMEWMKATIDAFKETVKEGAGFGPNLNEENKRQIAVAYLAALLGAAAEEQGIKVIQSLATFAAQVEDMILSAKAAKSAKKH